MFERFTDRARRVVVLAQEEARLLAHSYIGTEHILLGLVHEGDGVAARALAQLGISLDEARTQVEEVIGQGGSLPSGHVAFTPRAKKVLELALREALQLGHNYIGTEHLLLGLVREGEGVAAQVLVKMGGDLTRVRTQVMELLGHRAEEPLPEDVPLPTPPAPWRLPAEMHPACPHCRAPLAESGAVKILPVADVQAGHRVSARVVYCQACGLALGVLGP